MIWILPQEGCDRPMSLPGKHEAIPVWEEFQARPSEGHDIWMLQLPPECHFPAKILVQVDGFGGLGHSNNTEARRYALDHLHVDILTRY